MKLKLLLKTISYILILWLCVSLYGCGANGDTIDPQLITSHLKEETEVSDTAEADIKNNNGKILFSSPREKVLTVHDDTISFSGLCNSNYPLLLDGDEQTIGEDGYFTLKCKLELGRNEISFKNGDFSRVFSITYTRPLIKSYTPSDPSLTLDGGIPLSVTAVVKSGAEVVAKYNGKTYPLSPIEKSSGSYETYKCVVTTAKSGSSTIKITATKDGDSKTVKASKIVINSKGGSSYNLAPVKSMQNKGYVDVGENYVAEITASTAEGFLGSTVDDYSRPTVNYLPKGTMDYCSTSKIYDSESGKKYYLLRNNIRVYSKKKNVKIYKGKLPETNSITYSGGEIRDKHLLMNFKVDWRAPFRFVLGGQGYGNESTQNYNISSQSFSYVDITFCYSDALKGFTLPKNPIFKGYQIFKNSKDYTLRLHLKTKGRFWGWKATYTSSNQLQFSFLCPSTIERANNKYGYSLKGVKITVDAGHGGSESGTYNAANSSYHEKYYTLNYAKTLANELLKLGATVYITRTEDETISLQTRYDYITSTNCDLAVSMHFNGSSSGDVGGYFMGFFNPYTYNAAKSISTSISSTGLIAAQKGGVNWHYFNLSRVSNCPVVLAENGYLTGIEDYKKIKTSEFCKGYVEGMVRGIVNYFAENSGYMASNGSHTNAGMKQESQKITVSYASRIVASKVTESKPKTQSNTAEKKPISLVSSNASRVMPSEANSDLSSVSEVSPAESSETSNISSVTDTYSGTASVSSHIETSAAPANTSQ